MLWVIDAACREDYINAPILQLRQHHFPTAQLACITMFVEFLAESCCFSQNALEDPFHRSSRSNTLLFLSVAATPFREKRQRWPAPNWPWPPHRGVTTLPLPSASRFRCWFGDLVWRLKMNRFGLEFAYQFFCFSRWDLTWFDHCSRWKLIQPGYSSGLLPSKVQQVVTEKAFFVFVFHGSKWGTT